MKHILTIAIGVSVMMVFGFALLLWSL
jgi:nitrogen fixation-related uncharacterized protein